MWNKISIINLKVIIKAVMLFGIRIILKVEK